ncbi:MAG: substrate-binding domain-containing protein [Amylibacter sp.]
MKFLTVLAALIFATTATADTAITLASTTSTQNSGLYEFLLPKFTAETGITVHVVAVGTGQAIKIAQNGDADALLVHHRASEDAFVAEGYGIERRDVMYNDFVIIGPKSDLAGVTAAKTTSQALTAIHAAQSLFISRGDDSGTHKKERELWAAAEIIPNGTWYREIGAGMGPALNMAAATDAYLMSDRGTWLSFGNAQNLKILFEGESQLRNPYGLILVNPVRHNHVDVTSARRFADWITSPAGQHAIAEIRVENKQLFCPNAQPEQDSKAFCPSDSAQN